MSVTRCCNTHISQVFELNRKHDHVKAAAILYLSYTNTEISPALGTYTRALLPTSYFIRVQVRASVHQHSLGFTAKVLTSCSNVNYEVQLQDLSLKMCLIGAEVWKSSKANVGGV